jgi:phosphoribosylamine--glycine ligase
MQKATIVGAGAREYALARRLLHEGLDVFAVLTGENAKLAELASDWCRVGTSIDEVVATCQHFDAPTIVQDQRMLFRGLADRLAAAGLLVYGVGADDATIERDKEMALDLVQRVARDLVPPTCRIRSARDLKAAVAAARRPLIARPAAAPDYAPVVLDGTPLDEGRLARMDSVFTESSVLLQPLLEGRAFTLYALTDGEHSYFLPPVRSFPWLRQDRETCTGGMGVTTCHPGILPGLDEESIGRAEEVVSDVLGLLAREGRPYTSVIGAEFLLTEDGVRFVEFDCRLGDPEVVANLQALQTPLHEVLEATFSHDLQPPQLNSGASLAVSLVPAGYPLAPEPARVRIPFHALERSALTPFYGNIEHRDQAWFTGSSRAMVLAAQGQTLAEACDRMREINGLGLEGLSWREDILEAGA